MWDGLNPQPDALIRKWLLGHAKNTRDTWVDENQVRPIPRVPPVTRRGGGDTD